MSSLEVKHTGVFEKNYDALYDDNLRFIINQGGSRSSKTYSLCQLLIVYSLLTPNKQISVVRKTYPTLRATAMKDFFEVMNDMGLYDMNNHNKTEKIYTFDNGTTIEFFAADEEQKLRGRKRDVLWINEANELKYDDFLQLNIRTTEKIFMDFNPSDAIHWIYDLMSRDNCIKIHSTYKDNPFLSDHQVLEIEELINADESYYRIYALGERGNSKTTIYTHWKYLKENKEGGEVIYGLDFGYNHPCSLVECRFIENCIYIKELIYKSGLTVSDLIREMNSIGLSRKLEIICDSARPEIIAELRREGWNCKEAIKNVKEGIDSVKSSELYVDNNSINILKEISNYKWKTNGDIVLDEPVKVYDDAMDAMRYAIHWYKIRNKKAKSSSFRIHY